MFLFSCGTQQISVRWAVASDAERLAELYSAVQIRAEQCHKVLNAKDGSFAKRGGMFEISSVEDLRRILRDKDEKVLTGEYNGTVCGLLWFGTAKADTFADLVPLPEQREAAERMARARAKGSCGYAKEIISLGADTPREMPVVLFYAMMNEYVKNGTSLTVGEVYTIDKYQTQGQIFESGLLNNASYSFLLRCGGVELGRTRQKKVDLESYSVWKTPHILMWNTKDAMEIIRLELANNEWEIKENEN